MRVVQDYGYDDEGRIKQQKNDYNMNEPSGVRRILDWFIWCLSDSD